jgi:OOP family OmpA-OmpF porin
MKKTLIAAALVAIAAPAEAQWTRNWYLGVGAGQTQVDKELVVNREATIGGGTPVSQVNTRFDDKDSTFKLFGGYRFNEWLSIEANYTDLGEHSTDTTFLGGDPAAPAQVIITRQVKGLGLDAVLSAPLGERFSVFGRVGAFRAELDASAQLGGNVIFRDGNGETFRATSQRETLTRFGAGLAMEITRNIGARLEWERYGNVGKKFEIAQSGRTGEADMDNVSLSVLYRFR